MKLCVGLGNPGPKYARHRHNVGYMAVERIAARHGFGPWRGRFQGDAAEGRLGDHKSLLLKPQTFMNESGRAVGEAMRFYKVALADVVVLYDELDLAPGKMRLKTGGGTAGHRGLKSIQAHIGNGFRRVRIGIGHPGDKARVNRYVLHDFAKSDAAWLDPMLEAIAEAAPLLAAGDDANFMNAVALATQADTPAPTSKTSAAGRPSQRDLARNAAQRQNRRGELPPEAEAPERQGPLARVLRQWRAPGRGED